MEAKKVIKTYNAEAVNEINAKFSEKVGKEIDLGLKGKPVFNAYSLDEKNRLQVNLSWTIDGKTYTKDYPACQECLDAGEVGYMKFAKSKAKEGTTGKWFMFCMNRNAKHNQKVAKKTAKAKTSINLNSAKFKKLVAENPEVAEALKLLA